MDNSSPFVGRWTYRSFRNDPELSKEFNELRFGAGIHIWESFRPPFSGVGRHWWREMGLRLRWIFGSHMAEWSRPKTCDCRISHTDGSAQQRPGNRRIYGVIHSCKASSGLIVKGKSSLKYAGLRSYLANFRLV